MPPRFRPMGPDAIVNMSVWRDAAALSEFGHKFEPRRVPEAPARMVPARAEASWCCGVCPRAPADDGGGCGATMKLRTEGPSPEAFTFRQAFPAPASREELA